MAKNVESSSQPPVERRLSSRVRPAETAHSLESSPGMPRSGAGGFAQPGGHSTRESLRTAGLYSDGPDTVSGAEGLTAGTVIGPPERRFRLVSDLSGRARVWLARAVTSSPNTDVPDGVDEFRVLKVFVPTTPGLREVGLDERSVRVDTLNLRNYLAKIKTRVDVALKLNHPHIARAYGWWQGPDGWPFVEMEHLDHRNGRSLAQLLQEKGRNGFQPEIVLGWLRPIATALDYGRRDYRLAHQHLNADTVFVNNAGIIKLLAYGLAIDPQEPRSVLFNNDAPTMAAVAPMGTAAAEMAFRQDVFALALLAYQLLTGHSAYEFLGANAYTHVVLPQPAGLTDEAWRVLRRGLAYPSELCPTDAGQFVNDLEAAQGVAAGERPGRASNRRYWGLGAAGLGLAILFGFYVFGKRDAAAPQPPERAAVPAVGRPAQGVTLATPNQSRSVYGSDAEREADTRAFESARRVDTLDAYRLYLQGCPGCGYEKEGRAAILRIENQEKITRIKTAFEKALQALEHEKRGDQGDEALSHLAALAAFTSADLDPFIDAGRRRVTLGWAALAQASLEQGDLAQARQWLKKAEATQTHQVELARLTQSLEEAQTLQQARVSDGDAFAVARRANTRRAYWTYLERCEPSCGHRAEAEAALARLAPANPLMSDRLQDGSPGPEMVVIRAGRFVMGSPAHEKGRYNDETARAVRIDNAFAIGKYEVTFQEYDRFAKATSRALPKDQGWGRGRRPVINVSWPDAAAYTEWLSQQTNARYRLPTEAEWEYAARAGVTASRYWGDNPDQGCAYANAADLDGKRTFIGWSVMNCHDRYVYTAPVGSYYDNPFGLHDMLGNVLEWTCSLYDKDRPSPVQDCEQPTGDRQFVLRGGSWNDEPRNVRSADRHRSRPEFQDYFLGFRLVRDLP